MYVYVECMLRAPAVPTRSLDAICVCNVCVCFANIFEQIKWSWWLRWWWLSSGVYLVEGLETILPQIENCKFIFRKIMNPFNVSHLMYIADRSEMWLVSQIPIRMQRNVSIWEKNFTIFCGERVLGAKRMGYGERARSPPRISPPGRVWHGRFDTRAFLARLERVQYSIDTGGLDVTVMKCLTTCHRSSDFTVISLPVYKPFISISMRSYVQEQK